MEKHELESTKEAPDIHQRIDILIKNLGKTHNSFAKSLDIGNSVIGHIVNGNSYNSGKRNKPSFDLLMKIVDRYPQVCLEWLMLGSGPMFHENTRVEAKEEVKAISPDSAKHVDLLEAEILMYRKREEQLLAREAQLLDTIASLSKH